MSGTPGDPRATINVQIRGTGTTRGSNSPLVVIDGVPNPNADAISSIPPEEIESISVLKDASAAAIYGTRGANGVLLVQTKRGRSFGELRPTFDYSAQFIHQYVYKLPNVFNAQEYREWMSSGNFNTGSMVDFGYDTDWMGELLDKGNISYNHTLSFAGGSRTSNFRGSVFYRESVPVVIKSGMTNWGARLNTNHLGLNDRLEVQFNLSANFQNTDQAGERGNWEQVAQRNPTGPIRLEDGTWYEDGAYNSNNPIRALFTQDYERNNSRLAFSSRVIFNVMEGLKVSGLISHNEGRTRSNRWRHLDSATSVNSYDGGGRADKGQIYDVTQSAELQFDYSKVFGEHSLNVMGGYNYESREYENYNIWNTGWTTNAFSWYSIGTGNGVTRNTSYFTMEHNSDNPPYERKLAGFFGRVNYTYQGKYLFNATLRRDGSSRFGPDNRWGWFPAISAGWTITNEEFMKDITFINNLKFRVGYGVTGQDPYTDYLYMTTYSSSSRQPTEDGSWVMTFGPNRNPNPALRWEEKREFNAGFDFSVYKNRVSGTLDVFRRQSVGVIDSYNTQLPPFVQSTIWTNVGTMENTGIELGLNMQLWRTRDFRWNADVTYSYITNKLVSFSDDVFKASYREYGSLPAPGALGNAIRTVEGQSMGAFYGKRFAGFSDAGQWLFYNRNDEVVTLSQIGPDDMTFIGNGMPTNHASLNTSFGYKNLTFSMNWRATWGHDILNMQEMYFGNPNWFPNNVLRTVRDRHIELRDAPQYSDYYLEPGGYAKLGNASLSYNVPLKNRNWVRNIRVSLTGENLLTLTKYSGMDPSMVRTTGTDPSMDTRNFFPSTSSVTIGLQIGF